MPSFLDGRRAALLGSASDISAFRHAMPPPPATRLDTSPAAVAQAALHQIRGRLNNPATLARHASGEDDRTNPADFCNLLELITETVSGALVELDAIESEVEDAADVANARNERIPANVQSRPGYQNAPWGD